jgi:hypothetical protein
MFLALGRVSFAAVLLGFAFGSSVPHIHAARVQDRQVLLELSGTSANVREAGGDVRIELFRFSTAEERQALVASMQPLPPPPPPSENENGRGGRGGRGGFGGRGGRGGAPQEPPDPISRLTTAISEAPTVGYVWTEERAGYSVKYAHRITQPGGGDRIILALNRRLGGYTGRWDPVDASPTTDYAFTLVELVLDSDGNGEGKASLTAEVVADDALGTPILSGAATVAPVVENIRSR